MYTIIYAISINWLCLLAFSPFDFLFFFFFFIFFMGECLKQKRENIFFFLYKLDNKTDFIFSFFLASRNRPYIIPFLTLFSRMRRFSTLFVFFNHTLLIYPLLSNHVGWLGWMISLALSLSSIGYGLVCGLLVCIVELQLKIHLSWFPRWRRRWSRFFGNVLIYWWRIVQVSHSPR